MFYYTIHYWIYQKILLRPSVKCSPSFFSLFTTASLICCHSWQGLFSSSRFLLCFLVSSTECDLFLINRVYSFWEHYRSAYRSVYWAVSPCWQCAGHDITFRPGGWGVAQTCPSGCQAEAWWRSAGRSRWWNPNSASLPGPHSWATRPPRRPRMSCPRTRPPIRFLWGRLEGMVTGGNIWTLGSTLGTRLAQYSVSCHLLLGICIPTVNYCIPPAWLVASDIVGHVCDATHKLTVDAGRTAPLFSLDVYTNVSKYWEDRFYRNLFVRWHLFKQNGAKIRITSILLLL